jgi:hypothetical protein
MTTTFVQPVSTQRVRDDASMEQCGFVSHVLIVLLSIAYGLWIVVLDPESLDISRPTMLLSVSLICLFLAIPILYCAMNVATTPSIHSIHTITDSYSRPCPFGPDDTKDAVPGCTPEIGDIDVAAINDYLYSETVLTDEAKR